MSHSYDTTTYAIVPDPALLGAASVKPSFSYALQRSAPDAALLYTSGSTRSGWAIYQTQAILDRLDLPALAFLTDSGTEILLPTEGDKHGFSVIDSTRQPEIIAQFHDFFARLKQDPTLASDDDYGVYGDAEIAPALARAYVSAKPWHDYGNVAGEDGQSADYLFVYLRSVLAVIENAHADRLWAVHELNY